MTDLPYSSDWRSVGPVSILEVDLAPNSAWDASAWSWLDTSERARAERFVVERARRQFLRCRSALRVHLCERLGCGNPDLRFGYGEHGKPHVLGEGSGPSFNVSHSGTHGLIAFAPSGRLGVDLEARKPRENFDGLGARVYGAREMVALRNASGSEKAEVFYRLWALKEALIKALGTGFSLSPSRFEVPVPMIEGAPDGEFRFPHLPEVRWRLVNLEESRFAAAVACEIAS